MATVLDLIAGDHGDPPATVFRPLSLAEANAKLSREEDSFVLGKHVCGREIRTDVVRVTSNPVAEDYPSQGTIAMANGERWPYWGIYDGHAGWYTAKLLVTALPPAVARKLSDLAESALRDPARVSAALEEAFVAADSAILASATAAMDEHRRGAISHAEALARIAPANSGSCAIFVLLDPATLRLHVACAGDSRAVLARNLSPSDGREGTERKKGRTIVLSRDHTASDPDEAARVRAEHPGRGEAPIDAGEGRMLGCQVTRGFGNGSLKWPLGVLKKCEAGYFGKGPEEGYLTPPYMTARPETRSARVGSGDLLILASDGFWNTIGTNEDAVHCARLWSGGEGRMGKDEKRSGEKQGGERAAGGEARKTTSNGADGRVPVYSYYRTTPREDFVVDDDNPATHLARNALGGADRDLFCSILSCPPPWSREARDDATVMVVRF